MIFWFLVLTQTLAPSPVNFTREKIQLENRVFIVENMHNRITIHEEENLHQAYERQHLKEYIRDLYGDYVEPPTVEFKRLGCFASGCLLAVVFVLITVASFTFFMLVD